MVHLIMLVVQLMVHLLDLNYTISTSTTTITGNDDNNNSLSYDANFVDVYLNGVKQGKWFRCNSYIWYLNVFAQAIGTAGTDTVDIVAFGTFQLANINAGTAITSGTLNSDRLPVVPITKGGTGLSSLSGQAGKALV